MTEESNHNAITQANQALQTVVEDSGEFAMLLDSQKFNHGWRVATLYAKSEMVPAQFRGKPADCFIALQMAVRLHVDPFMLMQGTYIVHGKPGMEAKLAIALMNARGPFKGPIQWRFEGQGKARKCIAYAKHKDTEEVCEAEVTWEMVEKEGWLDKTGSKWKTMPDMMFRYRAATFLARLYAPECLMGMATLDELIDIGDTRRAVDSHEVDDGLTRTEKLAAKVTAARAATEPERDDEALLDADDADEPTDAEAVPAGAAPEDDDADSVF